MSSYRSAGAIDDPSLGDGDVGFVGMDMRRQAGQLEAGLVAESRNGRMDGFWQPRLGVELLSGALTVDLVPLQLPFFLINTGGGLSITGASLTSGLVSLTVPGHGLTGTAWLEVVGLGWTTTNPNGIWLVTVLDASTLRFSLSGGNEVFVIGGGDDKVLSRLVDTAVSDILGSCIFSNPASGNEDVIVIATNSVAKRVSLESPYLVTDLAYPGAESLDGPVELLQAFDRVMLFRGGDRPWHWLPGGRIIESAVLATNEVTVVCRDHGLTIGDVVTISGVGFVTTDPNGLRTVTGVVDADTFDFARTGASETYAPGTGKMVADFFTLAPAGDFTQPQTFTITGAAYGSSDGLLRLTVGSNETIRAGDSIFVRETDVAGLTQLVGLELRVTSATATDIYCYAPVSDVTYASGSGAESIKFGGRASLGGGFMFQPGAPWGVYFQRRLWVPYFYEVGGTYAVPTYVDRGTRDEIAASDILDADTFDRIESQFRITAGVADFLVAMHPFYDDALLVLNRNSLHIVVGTQGSLADTIVKELTREVGCLARKSLASQGNAVFFLSDNGVYGVEFIEGYNLRGISEPLSKPIQPLIDRISKNLASGAVGIYFNMQNYDQAINLLTGIIWRFRWIHRRAAATRPGTTACWCSTCSTRVGRVWTRSGKGTSTSSIFMSRGRASATTCMRSTSSAGFTGWSRAMIRLTFFRFPRWDHRRHTRWIMRW